MWRASRSGSTHETFGGNNYVCTKPRPSRQSRSHSLTLSAPRRYAAAVPAHALDEQGCLIDQLIHFAFDTLGARHLELRVYEAK